MKFDYHEAFSRNLGLVTEEEQLVLKSKKVAIAGMGGVGGVHLLTLARMGIGNFHIADMDEFELANFNRQAGAMMSTVGRPKAEVMEQAALDINPDCRIKVFSSGVQDENMDAFLDGVDVYVDGLDFYVLDVREKLFQRCQEKGIPAITAGPVGLSTAYLVFDPDGMSFEDYFQFQGQTQFQKAAHFLTGVTPRFVQKNHFVDMTRLDFKAQKTSSFAPACMACSGVMGVEVLKLLLGRGKVRYAPWAHQFDMYQDCYHKTYNWLGNRNPLNKLKIRYLEKILEGASKAPSPPVYKRDIEKILDLARWAPSGDNGQPWSVSLTSDHEFTLDLTKFKKNVYNLLPMPDYLSNGMFLENAKIAARQKGYDLTWALKGERVKAEIAKNKDAAPEPLYPYIKTRSVNRYRYKLKKLSTLVKEALDNSLDEDMRLFWFEDFEEKFEIAKILMLLSDIRLRLPEAYEVHRDMVDWSGKDSPDKMPSSALGMNPVTLKLMKWVLAKENRNKALMSLPGSTVGVRIELDLIPALLCSGHFVMAFDPEKTPAPGPGDYLRAGQAMQRFWLSLTAHHMVMHPWFGPVMFPRYIQEGIDFTKDQKLIKKAEKLHDQFSNILNSQQINLTSLFFAGRVGYPTKTNMKRSVRKPLENFLIT